MKKLSLTFLVICLFIAGSVCNGQGIISTYVTLPGGDVPLGMAMDTSGNIYYSCGPCNFIKKISPSGRVSIIAGTGVAGFGGDGGPATAALLNFPKGMLLDPAGNIYFSDLDNYTIRKITASTGIITTLAGNTSSNWWAGDGGPATAATLGGCDFITRDIIGNLYFNDGDFSLIRKIDTSGIISTFAGTPNVFDFGGDGGPASAAFFNTPGVITIDAHNNFYIADGNNNRIRKIDSTGTITTIAGNGTSYTGDGAPATATGISDVMSITVDQIGNIYFNNDGITSAVLKIDTSGIVHVFAGSATEGYSGDGGPPGLAHFAGTGTLLFDKNHDLYIEDAGNYAIRKVSYTPNIIADSFSVYNSSSCSGIALSTTTNDSAATGLRTYFGDGTVDTNSLLPGAPGKYASVIHNYPNAGTYTIKEVLMNGTTGIDSTHFSYHYLLCKTIDVQFYFDANGNCLKDSAESFNFLPVMTEVDSNGIAIDTISANSGFYYQAYGNPGDIYSFRVISAPPGYSALCSGGIVADTLDSITNNIYTRFIGFNCSTSSGFDLAENTSMLTGRHLASGTIVVNNNYCTPEDAVVTMNVDPKYVFESSVPSPSSIVGNTVIWNFSGMSAGSMPQLISYSLTIPGAYLTAGDTVLTKFMVTPITGDLDTTNNTCIRIDTIRSSYDPNEMSVTPSGYILPNTTLQYTINFENTGNDTAYNIAVMDTLPDNVNVNSLRIDIASAVLNTATYNAGGHNIIKFDFPGINLPDSSHHNQCNGMVLFHVKTVDGLSDGATLFNHAGIFFDDNPVVMTDTVENTVSLIHGPASVCKGAKISWSELANGGMWTSTNGSATISRDTVSGAATGVDTFTYTVPSLYGNTFATKTVTVNPIPSVYMVTGGGSICAGSTGIDLSLSGSDTGCVYQLYSSASATGAAIAGTGYPLDLGVYTVAGTYSVTATSPATSCANNMNDSAVIVVNSLVVPSLNVTTSLGDTVCAGSSVTFIAAGANGGTSPVYDWSVNGTPVTGSTSYTYTPSNHDLITIVLISDALCVSPDSATASITITVDSILVPIITINAVPGFTLAAGMPDTLTVTVSNAGAAPAYQWYVNGTVISGATSATLIRTFLNNDSVSCVVTGSGACALSSFNSALIHVSSTGVLQLAGTDGIQLVPNPNKGSFTLTGAWANDEHVVAEITDMLGQVVYKNELTVSNGAIDAQILLGSRLANGIYLLNLKAASGARVFHFILER